jgi:hypothetical protein
VLATSEPMLRSITDSGAAKATADPVMGKLLGRANARAAVWGVWRLTADDGARIAGLAKSGTQPATAVVGSVSLEGGLELALAADMQSEQDASELSTVIASQLPWLGIAADRWGLGRAASRARVSVDGKAVKVALHLEADETAAVEAALSKLGEQGRSHP